MWPRNHWFAQTITGAPKVKNVPLLTIPFPGSKPTDTRLRLQMVKLAEFARAVHDRANAEFLFPISFSMRMLLYEAQGKH